MALLDAAILSETLFVPLMLGVLVVANAHRVSAHRWRWMILGGSLVGLATLTRQNGLLLLVPLFFSAWTRGGTPTLTGARTAVVAIAVAAIFVIPWTIRNAVVLDAFVPVATQSGVLLAGTYNNTSRQDDRFPSAWRPPNQVPEYAAVFQDPSLNEAGVDRELRSEAATYARNHLGYVAQTAVRNLSRLVHLGGPEFSAFADRDLNVVPGWGAAARVNFWLVGLLALGALLTRRWRAAPWWLWFVPVVMLLPPLFVALLVRYRAPLDPFLIVLAATSVLAAWDRIRFRATLPAKDSLST